MGRFRSHRTFRIYTSGWVIASLSAAAFILIPLLYVVSALFRPANVNWTIVKTYLINDYVWGSLKLVSAVGIMATLIGTLTAWLVVGYDFPLRRFFRWALVLPLAVPPYIAAYTYGTMTGYTGFIQSTLRNGFGIWLPSGLIDLNASRGALFILTLFLSPYVFLLSRTYMERLSGSYIENGRMLGRKGWRLFIQVVLPLCRPAITGGLMLVIFETLSDYGVVSFFGLQTVSTAIFQTWFGMYDINSALRLAAWLLVMITGVFMAERLFRRRRVYGAISSRSQPIRQVRLQGIKAAAAVAVCSLVVVLGFLLPVLQLIQWSLWTAGGASKADLSLIMKNTLTGAAVATCFIMLLAVVSARSVRMLSNTGAYALSRILTSGYAIPGAIIAIGVLALFGMLDKVLSPLYLLLGRSEGELVLSLSLVMLLAGYVIRFMATGYNAVEAGYDKMPKAYTEAAETLGARSGRVFRKVELPLLKGSILSGTLLTFIEIVKELPLTLLLRPFNFDTLATRAYQYAIDERVYEAAFPSLLLLLFSLVSVVIMIQLRKGGGGA
jgi:iron(III) transport system permease protein